MKVKFYMDAHVPRAVTTALRLRGIDVVTAQQDGADTLGDDKLLMRASVLGRILISQDDDLLREGTRLQREGIHFAGIIYGHQRSVGIGQMVEDLSLIAHVTTTAEWVDRIAYLPL
ncbi:MAG: hypothetical protein FJW36_04925 [Acidobacteria bacterium]|nr:hypothetical protein [Acidobacteriota bacterium]